MNSASFRLTLLVSLSVVLTGCFSEDESEVKQWMATQRAQMKPKIEPLPEPKRFVPQAYAQDGGADPFGRDKLTHALRKASGQTNANAALVAPELARRKEPLEGYPLDAMTMVGSLIKQGQPVALLRVDNLLYQVRLGNYLGQNYGKVLKVLETEVVLREVVQDAAGEWIERTASLQLQEKSK